MMRLKYFCDIFKLNSHYILYLQQKLPYTFKHTGCIFSMLIIPTKNRYIADCEYAYIMLPKGGLFIYRNEVDFSEFLHCNKRIIQS